MAQVTRRTIRSPWSTGIPEYVWRHQANLAAHNVTRQLPTRRATKVLRTGTESAVGRQPTFRVTPDSSATPNKRKSTGRPRHVPDVPEADAAAMPLLVASGEQRRRDVRPQQLGVAILPSVGYSPAV